MKCVKFRNNKIKANCEMFKGKTLDNHMDDKGNINNMEQFLSRPFCTYFNKDLY